MHLRSTTSYASRSRAPSKSYYLIIGASTNAVSFFDLNRDLVGFFARHLFTARPDLRDTDLRGVERSCHSEYAIALEYLPEHDLRRTMQVDISALFTAKPGTMLQIELEDA